MSLSNTFRLFALSLAIVLSVIDTPANTFTISRTGDFSETIDDLDQEESIRLEVRDDFKRPNDIGVTKGDKLTPTTDIVTKEYVFSIPMTTIEDQTSENSFVASKSVEFTTEVSSAAQTTQADADKFNLNGSRTNFDTLTKKELLTENVGTTENHHIEVSSTTNSSEERPFPSWKKYTIINRKHLSTISNDFPKLDKRSEEMMTDETGNPLQDSKTGDIPSLNQIKNFLSFFKSDVQNDTTSSKEVTEQSPKENLGATQETNAPSTTDKETPATVESKRGGFLDFSLKSLFEDNEDKKDNSQELNTSRPKNRKLSWRIGSRFRGKEENSAEKQGRSRFRLRNDKDKNDSKTIKESQEEMNKNKETESKEVENDKIREKNQNQNNKERNDNGKKDESLDRKKQLEIKEDLIKDNKNKVDKQEEVRDKSGSKSDEQILKEWKDYDRKQERSENKNNKQSKEGNYKDKNEEEKHSKNKERSQSQSRNNNESSKESNKNKIYKDSGEEKSTVMNIWKIESKEDYDRSSSRTRNEKENSKEKDGDRRNEKPKNKKEDTNRENQNSVKVQMNEKDEFGSRSRSRNEDERINNERRENARERENDRNRFQSKNKEESSNNGKRKEKTGDRNNDRNHSQSKNEEERPNNDRRDNTRERENDRNRSKSKNEEEGSDNDKRKEKTADRNNERNRSQPINEEEMSNNDRRENTRDRNNERNRSQSNNEEERSNNDKRKEKTGDRNNERNRSQSKNEEERSYNDRRENTRDRENDRNRSQSKNEEERSDNDKRKEKTGDRNNERNRSQSKNEEERSNNDRSDNTRERENDRNRSKSKNEEERSDNDKRKEKTADRNNERNRSQPINEKEMSNNNRSENTRDRENDRNRSQSNNAEERSNNDKRKEKTGDRNNERNRSQSKNEEERPNNNRRENTRERENDRNRSQSKNEEERSDNDKKKEKNGDRNNDRNHSQPKNEEERSNNYRIKEDTGDRDNDRNHSKSKNEEEISNNDKVKEKSGDINNERKESVGFNFPYNTDSREYNAKEIFKNKQERQDINKSTIKIDIEPENKAPQTQIQEEFTENFKPSPKLDDYTKKFLSTIEEEDESETQTPTVLKDEKSITKTKEADHQNIVAVKYPSDFKFNDMDTTQENLEPNEPHKITTYTLPSSKDEDKLNENFDVRLPSTYSQAQGNQATESSQDHKNKDSDKPEDINESVTKDGQYSKSNTQVERQEDNEYEKQTSSQPDPNFYDEQTTIANYDYANVQNNTQQAGTIIQLNDDNIKEELLKEEMINNYEENVGRYKGDSFETTTQTTIPVKIYEINKPIKDLIDERLSVKPLNILEKLKTTILYPVSPNYKPPKKIDVQPPKTFVRDPDDNSWRNESLSSLGIVFNPKNSSKPFTQVLKNKTESEWNNLLEKNNKNETPDLRERLEKIAEIRKTKKKKTDAYGNVLYNDYEDNSKENVLSNENYSSLSTEPFSKSTTILTTEMTTTTPKPSTTTSTQPTTTLKTRIDTTTTTPPQTKPTTEKPKKVFNVAEYYDTSDDDDADYLTLAKIDLKKFTVPVQRTQEVITPPTWPVTNNRYVHNKHDDRKPTIQYFPPLTTQRVIYNKDNDFNRKMNAYTNTEPPTNVLPVSYTTSPPKARKQHIFTPTLNGSPHSTITPKPIEFVKDSYMTPAPGISADKDGYTFVTDDGSFNKASDVIKHYRDFLNAVAKDHDEDKNMEYIQFTTIPTQGVTFSDALIPKIMSRPELPENYDYDTEYKKDMLQRFVHNFNENSDRYKLNLPLLYNNSIIHSELHGEHGRDVASSRAYLGRLLSPPEGDCDNNSTVELSPAYELHYYVPEQEEKEEIDPKPVTLPYQYRL